MPDVEEADVAVHTYDRRDILPPLQSVAADMQAPDADILIIFARQRAPVEEDESRAHAVWPQGPVEGDALGKRKVGAAVEQQGPADLVIARLPYDNAPAAVQAALERLGIGHGVIARQETVAVGIFHRPTGIQGQQRRKRKRNQSIFHNSRIFSLPDTPEAVPCPADPHP